ncbi:unnamed protein product, partial [Prorocentrum cordatum]
KAMSSRWHRGVIECYRVLSISITPDSISITLLSSVIELDSPVDEAFGATQPISRCRLATRSGGQAATYYIIAGGNCPVSGRIWDTAECESAVASLGITASPRTEGTTGTWDWTPPGCWIRFGGTQWAVTITNASANNGQYRAICREPTPAPTAAPTPALLP